MPLLTPSLFIASSTESLDYGYALQKCLSPQVEATVWNQGIFELSRTSLASLTQALERFSYACFLLTPDDVTSLRSSTAPTPRDNVIFELGLFIGRLGPDRCFLILPRTNEPIHLPTDLLGVTVSFFNPRRSDANLEAALGPVSFDLRVAMGLVGYSDADSRQRTPMDEERARDLLLNNVFLLVYDPSNGRSKRITFSADGVVEGGSNSNEAYWRIRNGHLELLQADQQLHSRFAYQTIEGMFVHTNDADTLSKRNQFIQQLPTEEL
jgi:hypothetical protein